MIAISISLTALLFAISGFVLGLLGFIQSKASAQSTHTIQTQPQQDLSDLFGSPTDESIGESFMVDNKDLEKTLLQGLK